MTREGLVQYSARVISLTLFVSGLIHIGGGLVGLLSVTAAIAIIGLLPAPTRPQDAHAPDRLPAVLGPDLLGHALTGLFIALPLWTGGEVGSSRAGIHAMAILTWPMAIGGIVLVAIAAGNACRWMRIGHDALDVATAWRRQRMPYADLLGMQSWRRGLPRPLRNLAPFLAIGGHFSAAGALTLARDSTGIRLILAEGRSIVIEKDAFEKPLRRPVQILKRRGVVMTSQGER